MAVLGVASAAWVWRAMPDGVKPPALSRAAWGETFSSRPLMLTVAVTVLLSSPGSSLWCYGGGKCRSVRPAAGDHRVGAERRGEREHGNYDHQ